MRPVSQAFLTTLTGSHTMAARARVCTTFQTGTDPDGTTIPIIDGSVSLDGTADVRASLDLVTDGTRMWPTAADDLLTPYGNEIFVERGVQYSAGTTEWCSLGYFRIETQGQDEPPDGPIRIGAKDRMHGIIRARLLAPVQFASTVTYGTVMTQLVTEVYPSATIQWDDSTNTETLDRALICEEDRFEFLDDLVRSRGKIWYWDHRGILVIKDPPDPSAPVWDVFSGAGGVLVSSSRELTNEGVHNAVVASGEATDSAAPVRGVAIDDNPDSPTYFSGNFGPVPRFYSSPFLTTDVEALAAATAILRNELGLPYNVDFTAIVNPALEPYDPIRIRNADRSGAETHIAETLSIPLVADGAMTGRTREQTVVLIGSA